MDGKNSARAPKRLNKRFIVKAMKQITHDYHDFDRSLLRPSLELQLHVLRSSLPSFPHPFHPFLVLKVPSLQ